MTLTVRPLSPALGAEVFGVDPAAPLTEAVYGELRGAWLEHGLLLFRDVSMSPRQQINFTRWFGDLHIMPQLEFNLPDYPEIFVVSNVEEDGKPMGMRRVGMGWHTDGQSKRLPNAGSFLYALKAPPEGGDTMFANMTAAYDALPGAMRERITGQTACYSRVRMYPVHYPHIRPLTDAEKAALPDVFHPIARTHPETGRKALYVGRFAWEVMGMARDEGVSLIRELEAFATGPAFVYRHKWRRGDALLWDNRCTMHCATSFDEARYERHMHRTTIEGDVPI